MLRSVIIEERSADKALIFSLSGKVRSREAERLWWSDLRICLQRSVSCRCFRFIIRTQRQRT